MSQSDLAVLVKDDPFSDRPPRILHVEPGTPISEIVDMAGFGPLEMDHACASINGRDIPAELWAATSATGHVQVVVLPQGGDSGNKLLQAALTLAVIVAAFYLGPQVALAFAAEGTAGFAAISALTTGVVTTIGQLAINALVPPPRFEAADPPDPVYFIEGQRNRLAPFQPISTVFGTHRFTPRLAARPYPEIRGDDTYYYMVVDYGPIGVSVSDHRIGDTALAALDGVVFQERLVDSDPVPTMASRQVITDGVGATLGDADWEGRRSASDTIDCDLILAFPQGLGKTSKKGKPESNAVIVRVRYRLVTNPGPSETLGAWTFASVRQNVVYPEFRGFNRFFTALDGASQGPTTSASGLFTFTETKPQQPFFRQIGFSFPVKGTYDIEIQRATTDRTEPRVFDDIILQTVLSKREDPPVARDDVAWGVFRFKGTDETSGAIDELNVLLSRHAPRFPDAVLDQGDLSGVTAADLSVPAATSNMWEQILYQQRNGFEARNPTADANIDFPSFAAAAKDARDRGLSFDYVLQRNVDVDTLSNLTAAAGEGRVVRENNKLVARLDRPQLAPTHVFRDGTVRNVSSTKTFLVDVHAYRVKFNDAANGYRTREEVIYVGGHSKATATKFEPITITGKVNWDDLHKRIAQLYRNSRLQTETLICEVPVEAVDNTLKRMLRISVATRIITEIAASGIIRDITTAGGLVTAVTLDQESPAGPATGLQAIKWVRPGATALISAPSDLVTPGVDGRVLVVTLATPVALAAGPQIGDDYVIGPSADELYEGVLADAEEAGPGWLRLSLKQYAPARFDETGLTVPTYTADPVLPLGSDPPVPVYVSAVANIRQIVVNFSVPDGYLGSIAGLRVWRAFAPPAADPDPTTLSLFERLPDLAPDARQIIDAPGAVDDRLVYRVAAVSETGRVGTVMETPILTVADILPDMLAFAAVPAIEVGTGGVIQSVINVSFTPETDLAIAGVVIELRRVALDGGAVRLAEGSQPAYQEVAQISHRIGTYTARGLVAAGTYDVRAHFTGTRGEVGTLSTVLDVLMLAQNFGAIDWGNIGGVGIPANGATVGATWGVNIGGAGIPADNATVGATWGVNVGGANLPANNATVGGIWGTNITGPNLPDDNADVTAVSQAYLETTANSVTFTADYTGALDSGQVPRSVLIRRKKGNIDVSASTAWSIPSISGCTATIDNSATSSGGNLNITAVSSNGSITVRSVRDGVTLETVIDVTKLLSPPPNTGGSSGTLVNDSTFASVSGVGDVVISDVMTVTTGPNGQIAFTAPLIVFATASNVIGTWPVAMRWQYGPVGGAYVATGEAFSAPDAFTSDDGGFGGLTEHLGSVIHSPTVTGLSASTDYEVRLLARRVNGTGVKTLNFSGTASAQGS